MTVLRTVRVLDSTMAYREAGAGPPILLLHGNPTSSWLWRHVLDRAAAGPPAAGPPAVGPPGAGLPAAGLPAAGLPAAGPPAAGLPGDGPPAAGSSFAGCRWIAVDLIGMGGSGPSGRGYRLADHIAYVDGFIEALGLRRPVLVGHDWGVAIALDRLRRHPEEVRGVAFMEGHLRPLPGWDAFDEGGRELFQRLRTPGVGERMVLDENFFIDTLLPAGLVRRLAEDELAAYRAPYPDPASRLPLLQWAREIPVGGEPAGVAARMDAAITYFYASRVPKLLLHPNPGVIITAATVAWCRASLPSLTVTEIDGPAGHFLPEDRPGEVAFALRDWVALLS
jgi:haloalkane dehalogenase